MPIYDDSNSPPRTTSSDQALWTICLHLETMNSMLQGILGKLEDIHTASLQGILTVEEAARYLSLGNRTVLLLRKELPTIRLRPGRIGFRRQDLDRWAQEHLEPPLTDAEEAEKERRRQLRAEGAALLDN